MSGLFERLQRKLEQKRQQGLHVRRLTERMLLLGIEIGRGKHLTQEEAQQYAQTLPIARCIALAEEALDGNDSIRSEIKQAVNKAVTDWLGRAPELKATLEAWGESPIEDDLDTPSPERLEQFKSQLREIEARTGGKLTDEEFEQLVQKVLTPLDGI